MNKKYIKDLIKNKKFDEALVHIKELLSNENNSEAHNLNGVVLAAQNKNSQALEAYKNSIKKDDKNIEAYKNMAATFINTNDYVQAIKCYKKIISIDNKNINIYNNLAILCDKINNHEEALNYINKAINIDKSYEISYVNKGVILFNKDNKKSYSKAKSSLLKALEINPKNLSTLFILGKFLYEVDEIDEAIKYLKKHNSMNKKNYQSYYFLGLSLMKKLEIKEAINSFNTALTINPNHIGSLNMIGNSLVTLNDNKKAINFFERSINILESNNNKVDTKKDLSITYYNIGLAYRNMNDISKAELFFNKTINLSPNFLEAQSQLTSVKLMKNSEDSLLISEHLKDDTPRKDSPKIEELKNKLNSGLFDEVEKECHSLIKLNNSDKAIFYILLSHSLYGQFKLEESINYLEKSIEINPELTGNYRLKATLLSRLGKDQEAISVCKKLIKNNTKDVKTLIQLGFLYKKNNRHKKAKEAYEKALEIEPNNSHAQGGLSMVINTSLNNDKDAIDQSYKTLEMLGVDYAKQETHQVSSIRHDIEQAKYLLKQGFNERKISDFAHYGENFLNYLRSQKGGTVQNNSQSILEKPIKEIKEILMKYWSLPIIYNTKKVEHFLNPNTNWIEIEKKYLGSDPEFVVIDNFLSDEALIELRKFCLFSKVFLKEYKNDYLGAFGNMGFISPIHIGISRDLQKKLPKIFSNEFLNHMWAFKYDSKIGSGINVHADFAKVNLNFWITPDKYNLDVNSGGLKVYDTPPPKDWIFEKYNASQELIYEFLDSVDAGHMSTHYKCNRAVLFNSSLFHETEEINFLDKYEGRRINVTYLFGRKQ
ncbi:MAG: hypothetical protein CMD72_04665 [Gammaproteobacteria bacterium]|nr:hypothetical protein [Gammaproteobacteria bacterium]